METKLETSLTPAQVEVRNSSDELNTSFSPNNQVSILRSIAIQESQSTFLTELEREPTKVEKEYLPNHSLVNRIKAYNNTQYAFTIINDYTSDGIMSDRDKETRTLESGQQTESYADVDVILPLNESTVFITPDGYITSPGSAIRTSRRGSVTISETATPNVFRVNVEGGFIITKGRISEISNPQYDESSPFHELFKKSVDLASN